MQQANSFLSVYTCVIVLFLGLPYFALAGQLEPLKAPPITKMSPQTVQKVELGKQFFFDRRLSGDGTMSCASCHIPELGFCDGQAISLSYPTTKNWRNAPTLINVNLNKYLFHDGRVESLEDQALFSMMSAFEMNQNLDFLEEEIRSVPAYVKAIRKVFGTDDITRERIGMVIAAFERTLTSRNAPIDRYLNGDEAALSPEAIKGLEIFTGKGKCADCHFGANLVDNKFHALMVPENSKFQKDPRVAATRRFVAKLYHYKAYRTLAEDPGRYLITKDDKDWKAFKTPTLREIAKTAPYMHNGIFETLDVVITFFDRGGGEGNTLLKPIGLTAAEKGYLKTFIVEALSGEDIVIKYPKLP
jgi:cytochrome c peroxidase